MLVHSNGLVQNAIQGVTQSPWNHVGVVMTSSGNVRVPLLQASILHVKPNNAASSNNATPSAVVCESSLLNWISSHNSSWYCGIMCLNETGPSSSNGHNFLQFDGCLKTIDEFAANSSASGPAGMALRWITGVSAPNWFTCSDFTNAVLVSLGLVDRNPSATPNDISLLSGQTLPTQPGSQPKWEYSKPNYLKP